MALAEIKSFDSEPPPQWMGWNAACVGRLLDTNPDLKNIGTALCQVLVDRLLQSPETPFEFLLYRHAELEDRYCHVGTWTEPSGPVTPKVPVTPFSPTAAGSSAGHDELEAVGDHREELFLPLESHEGVLGFGLFRILDGSPPPMIAEEDLCFLSRIVGQVFEQLLQCDRLEFANQSVQTTVRYLESVLALSEDGIFLIDEEGRIVVANDGVENYFGQLPIDVVGELVQDVLPAEGTTALLHSARLSESRNEPVTRRLRRNCLQIASTGEVEAVFHAVRHDQGASGVLVRLRDLGQAESESGPSVESPGGTPGGSSYGASSQTRSPDPGVLVQPFRVLRETFGSLWSEAQPEGVALHLFQSVDGQLESIQARIDVQVLADELRTGRARWRDRPMRPLQLLNRAAERVSSRFLSRGIRLQLDVPEESSALCLDLDKWSVALGCILERAALHPNTERVTLAVDPEVDADFRLILRISSDLGPGGRLSKVQSCADAGTEESSSTIPLVHRVVRRDGGVLTIDWEAERVFTAEVRIPVADGSRPEGVSAPPRV